MKTHLTAYAVCTVAFLGLDALWLTAAGPVLYRPAIGHLMQGGVDWFAAAAFYAVYIAGLVGFAVRPSESAKDAAARGAGFGFVAYATYDLTNQATLAGWPWQVTAADLVWGTFASATACAITCTLLTRRARLTGFTSRSRDRWPMR